SGGETPPWRRATARRRSLFQMPASPDERDPTAVPTVVGDPVTAVASTSERLRGKGTAKSPRQREPHPLLAAFWHRGRPILTTMPAATPHPLPGGAPPARGDASLPPDAAVRRATKGHVPDRKVAAPPG